MAYNLKDYYFKKAKTENYAARSVFKLQEMDDRYKILRSGMKVLDLGAAPGSWSQYASQKVGKTGRVLGIDLQAIKITLPNALFIEADLRDLDLDKVMTEAGISPPFELVMSDMAPRTTGIRIQDQVRSFELCMLALEVAERFLKPGGTFIAKFFHSEEFESYRNELKNRFDTIHVLRPKSTRKESKEVFLIGQKYRPKSGAKAKADEKAAAAVQAKAAVLESQPKGKSISTPDQLPRTGTALKKQRLREAEETAERRKKDKERKG